MSQEGLTFLEPFFSSRVFDILYAISIVPFCYSNGLFAVLLAASYNDETFNNATADSIAGSSQDALFRRYTDVLSQLPDYDPSDEPPLVLLEKQIDDAKRTQTRLFCALFSVPSIVARLLQSDIDVDMFRFQKDFVRVLHSFVHQSGTIVAFDDSRFIMALRSRHITDARFITQHVGVSLRDFYSGLGDIHEAVLATAYFPDDGDDASALFDRLGITSENA